MSDEELIADFLRTKGATKCPTAYVWTTKQSPRANPEDIAALTAYYDRLKAIAEQSRTAKARKNGGHAAAHNKRRRA